MNVLLTCAGRRNYLIQFFRAALGSRGRVLAADAAAHAPALAEADAAFVLPPLADPCYIDRLLALCAEERVRLLVPLHDGELPLIARHQARFQALGTMPVISSPDVIEICDDKWRTFMFCRANGIATPPTYLTLASARDALTRGEVAFPLILKPRWGSGSAGIASVVAPDELDLAYALAMKRYARCLPAARCTTPPGETILIQEQCSGEEYGLEIVNDLQGRYVCTFAKRKLIMRAGETDRAITVQHCGLEALGARLSDILGHVGPLDCDVFVQGETCTVIEMNPRFGGGYPFAHSAGANLPAALIAWACGETPDPAWFAVTPHVAASKCDRIIVTSNEQ